MWPRWARAESDKSQRREADVIVEEIAIGPGTFPGKCEIGPVGVISLVGAEQSRAHSVGAFRRRSARGNHATPFDLVPATARNFQGSERERIISMFAISANRTALTMLRYDSVLKRRMSRAGDPSCSGALRQGEELKSNESKRVSHLLLPPPHFENSDAGGGRKSRTALARM